MIYHHYMELLYLLKDMMMLIISPMANKLIADRRKLHEYETRVEGGRSILACKGRYVNPTIHASSEGESLPMIEHPCDEFVP
jgi:hypothetical protein